MDVNPGVLWKLAQAGGLTGSLLFVIYSGWKRWWVFGWQLDEMQRDRDYWKNQATGSVAPTDNAVHPPQTASKPRPKDPLKSRGLP
jgi:hypothetical protein